MSVPKRFGVLRVMGTLLKVIAWIFLILAILTAIGLGLTAMSGDLLNSLLGNTIPPETLAALGPAGGIVAGVGALLFGLFYFLLLYATGESLHLQLALEENTRLTAALLLRMHQESHQADPRATYSGSGFTSDPFER
ncbi:MAG: hypothetical protein KF832_20330 [Caldilineaceae bacterium]|nr:hypothetical protein [Caldilineaceae bacterium]